MRNGPYDLVVMVVSLLSCFKIVLTSRRFLICFAQGTGCRGCGDQLVVPLRILLGHAPRTAVFACSLLTARHTHLVARPSAFVGKALATSPAYGVHPSTRGLHLTHGYLTRPRHYYKLHTADKLILKMCCQALSLDRKSTRLNSSHT